MLIGGVAVYISSNISCCELSVESVDNFEVLWSIVRPKQLPRPLSCLIIAVVYCPPNYDASTMKKNCHILLFCLVIDYCVITLMEWSLGSWGVVPKLGILGGVRGCRNIPVRCGFLFAFYSNYGRICSHLWDIQCQRMVWPWKLGQGRFKVIKNGTIQYSICDFLLVGHCKYSSILYHFRVTWGWIISCYRSLKVIETGAIQKLWCGFLFALAMVLSCVVCKM